MNTTAPVTIDCAHADDRPVSLRHFGGVFARVEDEDADDEAMCRACFAKHVASVESVRSLGVEIQHSDDAETRHRAEDAIAHGVLRAIAAGLCADPRALAVAALHVVDVDRLRWFA